MTALKVTTKTVNTEEVETKTVAALAPMPDTGRPYILESAEFDAFIFSKRKSAQRQIDELDLEISRLQAELEARLTRKQDLMKIVYKADAILSMKDAEAPFQLAEPADA